MFLNGLLMQVEADVSQIIILLTIEMLLSINR